MAKYQAETRKIELHIKMYQTCHVNYCVLLVFSRFLCDETFSVFASSMVQGLHLRQGRGTSDCDDSRSMKHTSLVVVFIYFIA